VKRDLGVGRLLIAAYGIFAISASARAGFQLFTKFSDAPLAYALSALSAAVYVLATLALAKAGPSWRRIAWITVGFEFVGVIAVGLLSLSLPSLFDHPTVWSNFGAGYGYVPALLPVLAIIWLLRKPNK
jgi:hypothetical protein